MDDKPDDFTLSADAMLIAMELYAAPNIKLTPAEKEELAGSPAFAKVRQDILRMHTKMLHAMTSFTATQHDVNVARVSAWAVLQVYRSLDMSKSPGDENPPAAVQLHLDKFRAGCADLLDFLDGLEEYSDDFDDEEQENE